MKLRNLGKESASPKHLESHAHAFTLGNKQTRRGQPAVVVGLVYSGRKSAPRPHPRPPPWFTRGCSGCPSRFSVLVPGRAGPRRGESFLETGAPTDSLALARGARSAREGLELCPPPSFPVRGDPRECESNDVSSHFSCTIGNALGLPPSCPEKVGLASPGGRRNAGRDLVSRPQRRAGPPGRWLPGAGSRDTEEDARTCDGSLSRARQGTPLCWTDGSVGRSLALGRPRHLHNRTPAQVRWAKSIGGLQKSGRIMLNNADCRGPE